MPQAYTHMVVDLATGIPVSRHFSEGMATDAKKQYTSRSRALAAYHPNMSTEYAVQPYDSATWNRLGI
jgi:hypothetical protein